MRVFLARLWWVLTSAISLYLPSMEVRRSIGQCLRARGFPGNECCEVRRWRPARRSDSESKKERRRDRGRKEESEWRGPSKTNFTSYLRAVNGPYLPSLTPLSAEDSEICFECVMLSSQLDCKQDGKRWVCRGLRALGWGLCGAKWAWGQQLFAPPETMDHSGGRASRGHSPVNTVHCLTALVAALVCTRTAWHLTAQRNAFGLLVPPPKPQAHILSLWVSCVSVPRAKLVPEQDINVPKLWSPMKYSHGCWIFHHHCCWIGVGGTDAFN